MEDEPRIEWDAVEAMMLALMRLEAKLEEIRSLLVEEDDNGEEELDA